MAVGRIFDGAVAAAIDADPHVGADHVLIPVVGECDDSWLSDARVQHVEPTDAGRALAAAGTDVAEGSVGAGTGMVCFGCAGGIGTSSRLVAGSTVGVLVLANFGAARELRVGGVEVGRRLGLTDAYERPAGSCIVVLAGDAALRPDQLQRVARRAGLGLARAGSTAHHGSGEIFVAFATGTKPPVADRELDPLFQAAVDATEEAVLNALWAGDDVTGRAGRTVRALPRDGVLQLLGLGR
jgi:D-aminopeptidase